MKGSIMTAIKTTVIFVILFLICAFALSCDGNDSLVVNGELAYSISDDGTYYIVVGRGDFLDAKSIVVPDEYNGLPVKIIRNNSLGGSKLESIEIGDNVEIIESEAIHNSGDLKKVVLGSSVREISDEAFRGCKSLQSISFPESVEIIGSRAFADCEKLTKVTVNNNFYKFHPIIFEGSYNIQYKEHAGGKYLGSEDNPYALLVDYDIENYKGEFEIHKDTEMIGYGAVKFGAFSDSETNHPDLPEEYHIPDNVRAIGNNNFSGSKSLKSLYISENVRYIGKYCFGKCLALDEVLVESKDLLLDQDAFDYYDYIHYVSAVYFCGTVEEWNPNSIIGGSPLFYYSEDLPSQDGNYWRYVNGKPTVWLETLKPSDRLEYTLSDSGDYYTIDMKSIFFDSYLCIPAYHEGLPVLSVNFRDQYYSSRLRYVVIEDGIKEICANSFKGCSYLEKVILPNTLTSVGECAFSSCTIKGSVQLPDSLINIGKSAFSHSVTDEIIIGKGVTENLADALYLCEAKKITVSEDNPAYCSYDGDVYDKSKETLVKVTKKEFPVYEPIPSVKYIEENAFYCSGIEYFVIGEGFDSISQNAFYGSSITTIVVPLGKEMFAASWEQSYMYLFLMCGPVQWENIAKNYKNTSFRTVYYVEKRPYTFYEFWHYDHRGIPTMWQ